ncbi:MAG: hypothetical protein JWQ27_410 [Ferruginibacter sp.]|nr:hypothetical protein [Ferruginibacter sp.]
MKKQFFLAAAVVTAAAFSLASCDKNDSDNSMLQVRMTDAPTALDSVLIDIREVRVKMSDDSTGDDNWTNLSTQAGVYNLLSFQNGVDTLLASGSIPAGNVKQLRFVLGTNNRVVASGVSYPLTVPSGAESGLKINLNKNISSPLETLLIDFDAAASIKLEQGGYKLRPVLKIK